MRTLQLNVGILPSSRRASLLVALLLLGWSLSADATRWEARDAICPLCGRHFERMVLLGLRLKGHDSLHCPQVVGGGSPLLGELVHCPHCNYTALAEDFAAPTNVVALRQALGVRDGQRSSPSPSIQKILGRPISPAGDFLQEVTRLLELAEQCYRASPPTDPEQHAELARIGVCLLRRSGKSASAAARTWMSKALEALLGLTKRTGPPPSDPEQLQTAYLIGELARQLGQPPLAVHWFSRAESLAGAMMQGTSSTDAREVAEDYLRWIERQRFALSIDAAPLARLAGLYRKSRGHRYETLAGRLVASLDQPAAMQALVLRLAHSTDDEQQVLAELLDEATIDARHLPLAEAAWASRNRRLRMWAAAALGRSGMARHKLLLLRAFRPGIDAVIVRVAVEALARLATRAAQGAPPLLTPAEERRVLDYCDHDLQGLSDLERSMLNDSLRELQRP